MYSTFKVCVMYAIQFQYHYVQAESMQQAMRGAAKQANVSIECVTPIEEMSKSYPFDYSVL